MKWKGRKRSKNVRHSSEPKTKDQSRLSTASRATSSSPEKKKKKNGLDNLSISAKRDMKKTSVKAIRRRAEAVSVEDYAKWPHRTTENQTFKKRK